MATLDEKKAGEEIQRKRFRTFYYCYGEEPYKLEHFSESLKKALFADAGNSFNVEIFYGDELNAAEFVESAQSFSLWQSKKLLVVRSAERIPAKQHDALKPLVEQASSDGNTVLFLATKADARTKFIQSINKAPVERCALIEFSRAADWELQQWARVFAKEEGKELDDEALRLLVDWHQDSLFDLRHSVQKAALFAAGADSITEASVRAVSVRARPESVFEYVGAILHQERARSLHKLEYLLEQGEEPLALVGLLARQYRWLIAILALRAEGKRDGDIQAELRLFPTIAKDLFHASKRLGSKGVIRGLSEIMAADLGLKSSREPAKNVLTKLTLTLLE